MLGSLGHVDLRRADYGVAGHCDRERRARDRSIYAASTPRIATLFGWP